MKTFKYSDAPIEVHGLPFFEKDHILERIPDEWLKVLGEKNESLKFLGKRCPGARLCFRTNSTSVSVKMTLSTLTPDRGMSPFAGQSIEVFFGPRTKARFAGLVTSPDYQSRTGEASFAKDGVMEDVTLFLPRNEQIKDIEIAVDDGAAVEAPTPYKYPPMLCYGSSITEGGCCRVTNVYSAMISNHLDIDYYNYGFSGSARGELEMADLINTIPMSIFIYDYDHNAPTAEHLANTHEPFFRRIREKNPKLPVIFLTRPNFFGSADDIKRREIIRATYEHALADGDNNVWFIDGESFFGDTDRYACTCDNCHPNDLGFYRMTQCIEPVVKHILETRYPD